MAQDNADAATGRGKMQSVLRDALERDGADAGLAIDEQQWARLERLGALWLRYGRAMNLSGAKTPEALGKHIADALATVRCARRARAAAHPGPWIDVGSGGGLPGLVVAALVEAPLWLFEPREKRAAFLELATHAIGRGDVVIRRCRVDRVTWNENLVVEVIEREKTLFNVASARAVMAPASWLETGMNVVQEDGHVLVHVGEGSIEGIPEVPDHAERSAKGRVLAFRATPAVRGRFAWRSI